MFQYTRYYGQFQDLRGSYGGLPPWARSIVGIFAIPGIILILLSILAFVVSVLALLLLVLPVYAVMKTLTGPVGQRSEAPVHEEVISSPRRHVDVTIVE